MRALVDHSVLAGYVSRAKMFYPLEYAEYLLGVRELDDFLITVIDRAYGVEADSEEIEFNHPHEFGETVNGQTLLGTIHSHPNWTCDPSEVDLESAAEPPSEQVFGIVSLSKSGNRWLTSYGFYTAEGRSVELVVSKPEKKKGTRNVKIL